MPKKGNILRNKKSRLSSNVKKMRRIAIDNLKTLGKPFLSYHSGQSSFMFIWDRFQRDGNWLQLTNLKIYANLFKAIILYRAPLCWYETGSKGMPTDPIRKSVFLFTLERSGTGPGRIPKPGPPLSCRSTNGSMPDWSPNIDLFETGVDGPQTFPCKQKPIQFGSVRNRSVPIQSQKSNA